jgi:hypothetical protein
MGCGTVHPKICRCWRVEQQRGNKEAIANGYWREFFGVKVLTAPPIGAYGPSVMSTRFSNSKSFGSPSPF